MKLNFRRGSAFASKKAHLFLKTVSPSDIKNITVIRHAAIGDFMNIRPFLIEVRKFFPNAQITLSVVEHYMYGIPEDLIDNVHIMNRYKVGNKGEKASLYERIKQAKMLPPQDIIFDLTDSTLTLLLVFLSQSKLKIGYSYTAFRRYFYDIATLRSDLVVEAQSVLHMLNILGASTMTPLEYGNNEKYPKHDLKQVVYFAGASVKNKCWEEEKFKSLIDRLSDRYKDYNHIILQGIGEDEKFLDIYKHLQSKNNILLQETISIEKVMQMLSDTRCLVSNDTGVRNMAISLQTPTIGIFFDIPPFRYWPREKKHDCVFNVEYTSPSVTSVYDSASVMIDKLYEK